MSEQTGLLAGYAKIDITPDYEVGLGGYSNAETRRNTEGVADRIYATCIALSDGDETILVYTIDNCACGHDFAEEIRGAVKAAVGIDGEKIFCAATHSHSCPGLGGHPEAERYRQQLLDACAEGAKKALADRAPAKTMAAKKRFPGMNSTRHVELANGTFAGYGWRKQNSPIVGPGGFADNQMVLVKFAREGKKDILLINWQGHPDCTGQIGMHVISPSFVGPLRDTLAVGSGMEVAYFTGADGNMIIDCGKFFPELAHNMNYRRYGVQIGALALDTLPELVEVEGTGIATARAIVEVDVDHSWDHMLPQAEEVYALWKATDKPTGDVLARSYNMSSVYHARAIRSKAKMGKTKTLEVNAFRVGGIGFTTGTYEMFSESGIQVKGRSPYEYTMVLTGNSSYIPSAHAHDFRCYEADTGFYAKGVAEKLVDKYVEMLEAIQ
jgi:hypothetical protein